MLALRWPASTLSGLVPVLTIELVVLTAPQVRTFFKEGFVVCHVYLCAVTLYDCNMLASDCSSCVSVSDFQCGWCDGPPSLCSVDEECTPALRLQGSQCPQHTISGFSPASGPPSGGTLVTISGTDLGVTIADFRAAGSGITIGGIPCDPQDMGYELGRTVVCETKGTLPLGPQEIAVTLLRNGAPSVVRTGSFVVILPTVSSVMPTWGSIAGGSQLRVSGTGLDIGNAARVTLNGEDGPECLDM